MIKSILAITAMFRSLRSILCCWGYPKPFIHILVNTRENKRYEVQGDVTKCIYIDVKSKVECKVANTNGLNEAGVINILFETNLYFKHF